MCSLFDFLRGYLIWVNENKRGLPLILRKLLAHIFVGEDPKNDEGAPLEILCIPGREATVRKIHEQRHSH